MKRQSWLIIFVFSVCGAGTLQAEAVFRSPGDHSNDTALRKTQSLLQDRALEFAKTMKGTGARAIVRLFNALETTRFALSLSDTSLNRIQFGLEPLKKSGEVEWQVSMLRVGLNVPNLIPNNRPLPMNGYLEALIDDKGLVAGATYSSSASAGEEKMLFSLTRPLSERISVRWDAVANPYRFERTGIFFQYSGPIPLLNSI